MDDEQWPAPPPRGGGQRQRPTGGTPGPLSGQRPGSSRPPNASPASSGRPSGTFSGVGGQPSGASRPLQRPGTPGSAPRTQGQWQDDEWGSAAPPRRGASGPVNPTSGTSAGRSMNAGYAPSSPANAAGRRSGALGSQGGRGQVGQRNTPNARGWADEEDLGDDGSWGMRGRQQRSPSGQLARGKGRSSEKTTVRGNWVIETDPKGGSSGNALRKRLLMLLLAVIIVLGGIMVLVPSARARLLSYLPGSSNASQATSPATGGGLTIQVNVPSAKVTVDQQTQTTQASQTAPFSTTTFQNLANGKHTLTIHADNFADLTNQTIELNGPTTLTAWLAPSQEALNNLGNQFAPATQPGNGVAGDYYQPGQRAAGKFTVTISYKLSGFTSSSFTSQITQGADTKNSPFQPVKLKLTPTITFKSDTGATLATVSPQALPDTQFALQATPTVDEKGAPQLNITDVTLPQNVTINFGNSPAGKDYLLLYTLASLFPQPPAQTVNFVCVGAVDQQTFNPENGLFLVDSKDDTNHAHYFYRWGILWATNSPAFTLTPKAPHALAGSNEFNDANQARQNGKCGG